MIVEGVAELRVSSGGALARARKNYASERTEQAGDLPCTFSKRQAQAIILSLLPSVLMIVTLAIR